MRCGYAGGFCFEWYYYVRFADKAVFLIYCFICFVCNRRRAFIQVYFKRTFLDLTESGRADNCERTLIVGAGNAGRMVLTEIQNAVYDENSPARNLMAVGFVDDDETKLSHRINGVPVLGICREIPKICNDNKITNIIVAIPSCEEEEKRKFLITAPKLSVKSRLFLI